nr:unnamed protein product [Digitaria exilis]
MAAVAPAAGHAADLLQKLSLDPKSEGGKGPERKEKPSGGPNGVSKGGVVSPNPPVLSAEPWTQQDYNDAAMYYSAYPGAYYCGGWGDYSVYVSQDGADALSSGVYGDMYCYPQYGIADGQIYGSQHYQYPSTYYQPKTTASKPVYKAKTGKSSPSQDVSTATAADRQPANQDASKTTSKSIDGVKGLKKETLPLKPNERLDAKFFIIKSYSEDDVHKSIKYNVWASTPSGNKKLDAAYEEAKKKSSSSPVFLLFSVNTSGQFVGLAEMMGRVDFNKTVEYWQQDKWTGCFPVKWHIVKDIPNSLLKHIILEYNENKPVTNSRDTQEVKLDQGLQILKIFKDHVCKTSILDDFGFYDNREKIMQEKKSRRQYPVEKVMNRKLLTTINTENEATDGKQKPEIVGEQNAVVENGAVVVAANGVTPREQTVVVENGVVAVAASSAAPKDANPTTEVVAVANGC